MAEPFWDFALPSGFDAQSLFGGENTSPVDLFKVNGNFLPGPARVRTKRKAATHKKKSAGTNGETATHLGYDVAEIQVSFRMWLPEQWEAWQKLIPILQPKPGKDVVTSKVTPKADLTTPGGLGLFLGAVNIGDGNLVAPTVKTSVQAAGPQPLSVYHPFLAAYGIKTVWCEEIGIPQATNIPQVFEVTIVFREFLRSGGAVSTKKQAKFGITDVPVNRAMKSPTPTNYVTDKSPQPPSQTSTGPNTDPRSYTPSLK